MSVLGITLQSQGKPEEAVELEEVAEKRKKILGGLDAPYDHQEALTLYEYAITGYAKVPSL